jgi:hypothetical protein
MKNHGLTIGLLLVAITSAPSSAQSLSQRIARVADGTVRMSFAARPDVCGRGTSISRGSRGNMTWGDRYSRDVEWDIDCDNGPVRVVFDVRGHEIAKLRTYVGGRWRAPREGTVDLGTVGARDAATLLLSLADTLQGSAGREAIFPATLADSATVWPSLVRLARNDARPRETRRQAVFWLSQLAEASVTPSLDSIARDGGIDRDVREQAVFALSQRPRDEGVPALIRIAKSSRDSEVRRKALFWLGQSDDPRAIALFEEMLSK